MKAIVCSFGICILLCLVFLILGFVIGKGSFSDREKSSCYECGFEPMGPTRVPFSLRFFLVAVIFLVFDLEVVLLFPCVLMEEGGWVMGWMVWLFLFILSLGLGYEWNEGSLEWKE